MSEELATIEEAGVAPRLTISPRRKAAIMTIALGPAAVGRGLPAHGPGGDRRARARDRRPGQGVAGGEAPGDGGVLRVLRRAGVRRPGRHRLREGRPGAGARRPEGRRDHGPPLDLHPGLAVRVPAQDRPDADLQLPAARAPADGRADHGLPARRLGRDGARDDAPGPAVRGRHAHRADGSHGARGGARGRAGHGAQALEPDQPGPRRGRRRQAARRHPQLRRPRRPRATSCRRSTSATRSWPTRSAS